MMQTFRPEPNLPPGAYQTYAISQPRATHTRVASCEEVNCVAQCNGWVTSVDVSTELGRRQSHYIRALSGRRFTFSQAGSMQTFEFPPGERCFREHRISLDRPSLFLKIGGDWRAYGPLVQMKPADWVDDFAEHQDGIVSRMRRG